MNSPKRRDNTETPGFQVRQDRHIIEDLELKLRLDGATLEVINFSFFGLAVTVPADNVMDWPDEVTGILELEGTPIQTVRLLTVRKEKKTFGYFIALRTSESAVDVEKVIFYADAIRSLKELKLVNLKFDALPDVVKAPVHELRSTLEVLKEQIDGLNSGKVFPSFSKKESFEEAVISIYSPHIKDILHNTNVALAKSFEKLDSSIRPLAFDFYRTQLKHLIYQSLFAESSLKKARGYAGDYEMMNLIYRNEGIGKSLFSRCMEQGIQLHQEPGAVRNRASYLKEKILKTVRSTKGEVRILSVACGPAMEVQYALKEMTDQEIRRTEFLLLDQDEEALKDAEKNVRLGSSTTKPPRISLVHQSMKSVIVGNIGLSDLTLVYSAGLFDYFTDPVACRAGEFLLSTVQKKGQLIIGNFDIMSTNLFAMLAIFDWHLVLRSKEQLKQMFTFPGSGVKIEAEPNGVNLFCVIEKSA